MQTFIIIVVVTIILVIVIQQVNSNKRMKNKDKMLNAISAFTETRKYEGSTYQSYLGIDDNHAKVLLARITTDNTFNEIVDNFTTSSVDKDNTNEAFILVDDERKKVMIVSISVSFSDIHYKIFEDFICTSKFISNKILLSKKMFYAVDDKNEKIIIGTLSDCQYREIFYSDIISVELIEDGNILHKKSTMRTIGGGIVGGILAGGTGAIIGGLSGSSQQERKVKRIELKILLRSVEQSSYVVTCYNSTEIKASSIEYKNLYSGIDKIKDIISIIIDKIDKKESVQNTTVHQIANPINNIGTFSIADELIKLIKLKEQGVLTSDEFDKQKANLLS